jgi:transposase-like protein
MNEKEAMKFVETLSDEVFIKVIRNSEDRIQKIKKEEKNAAIDEIFREKGVECPKCKSIKCVKNGKKDGKQKYLCKDCKASFDAFRNHFSYWSHLSAIKWEILIRISNLGQSARIIAGFVGISQLSAWKNRQKYLKSQQLDNLQKKQKLQGKSQIDEAFIKEIHKGNFKSKEDPRRQYINPEAKDKNTCIVVAVDENLNVYVKATSTKRLEVSWAQKNLTNDIIEEGSILITDKQIIYETVAKQTGCKLQQMKHSIDKENGYLNLKNVSKAQSNMKEFITHYHGIGFTNIQDYLNLWKYKYQHYGVSPYQQSKMLYFNL